jgi:hypothetical protein
MELGKRPGGQRHSMLNLVSGRYLQVPGTGTQTFKSREEMGPDINLGNISMWVVFKAMRQGEITVEV